MGGLSLDWHAWLDTALEASILIILIMEYRFDAKLNQHVKDMKKRTKRRFEFEELTKGESR